MAVKAKQQYYADNTTLKKEAREFGMIDELKEKLDSVEWGAQVNVIEEVQENGVPLEIVDKTVNVLVPEVIDNLYTIDPNNSLSAKQGKILYDMIKNLLSRGRFLSTWNTATGLPLTNPEESPYPYKAGDYYIVGVTAQEGGTNFRPEPVEYVINVASDEQETSEVHVSDIYVYDGEKWILLINSTRELAVDDYVDYTYQSTNPVENQAIARELVKKQNIFHYIGNTAPTPQNEGDEWYDTANDKLKVWDGEQWNEVGNGDTYTAGLHISIDPNDNNKISVVEWSATASGLGLVKLGSDTVQSTSPNNVTSTTGRTYRIQANGSGQLMVNVPWTDTTYSAGTGIAISNNRVISCTVKPVTVGPTAPSTPGTGDLWYDTNKNTMFLYKNNTWTIIGPEIYPITKADYDALTPAEQGDGRFFLITDNDGTIYVDWENVQNRPMYIGTTSPANPCEGYLWYDTTNDVLKIYNGTQWNEVGGGGTTYTAGNGISISNDEISIDTTVVATKTDLSSKQDTISDLATIRSGASAGATAIQPNDNVSELTNDAGYITSSALDNYSTTTEMNNAISTATSGLATESYVDTALSSKQDTLTAGANITIAQDGTISAIDTTYTAGTGIDITNGVISNTQTSAEWGNITGTLSDQTDLQNALDNKQDVLVSGTNIKTVNNTSLLGNGNIDIPSGKNDIYVGTTAPSDTSVLWLNNSSSSDRRLLYYDRGNWKPLGKTFVESRAPSNVDEGDLWFDESNDTLKVYDASGWNAIEIVHTGGSAPYEYKKGALWIDNYDVLYYYNIDSGRTPIATLFVSNTNPKSKSSYWYDGQMRYDTANNVLKIHKGYNRLTGDDTADWYPFIQAYTAGDGINITSGEISVDASDIAGTGLTVSNNNLDVDSTVVALKSDLSNYYTKTETYTKTEVDNLVANVGSFEVVATLPSVDTADTKKIYLLGPIGTGADKYEEYIVTESGGVKSWTKIGETSMDLSNYVTSTQLATTLQDYATSTQLATKQDTLVSGTNIKTINNESLLGSGNITISAPTYTAGDGIDITNNEISVDTNVIQEKLTAGDGISITGGTVCTTESDRKGPAPSGFHVPSITEWQGVNAIMKSFYGTMGDGYRINLHMPFAGRRYNSFVDLDSQGSNGYYWSSSPYNSTYPDEARYLVLSSSFVSTSNLSYRASGFSVRAFKNTYVAPDSSWTVIQGTLGSAGIFWNQSEGLISITDGTTGYTIMDKNLGATTVYSDGDTLTQANMGNMYQWGNNYGFPSTGTISKTSNTQVDASGYGPTNPYSSDTYIIGSNNWSSVQNDDLWGNTSNSTHEECVGSPLIISSDTTVLATKTDLSGKQDKATSGSTAPSTTPTYVGQQYIDTTADKMYVATGTTSSSDWTEVGAGSGDMLYSDFGWDALTGASVTLSLRGEIEPSANFTVNKPNDLKDGQFYVLRVNNGATAYTMTLGTGVTNPYSEDLTLVANNIQQFMFLAKGGNLELQPSTEIDISGKQDKATSGSTAPSTTPTYIGQQYIDTTNDKLYVATGTSSSSDWIEVGAGGGVTVGTTAPSNPSAGDLWYDTTSTVLALKVYNGTAWQMVGPEVVPITQAAYDALSTAEKNNGKFYLITNASGTISVDWANITNKPSLQSKTTVGNAAPSTAPTEVGTFYLDSTNDKLYVAVGTTASTDWLEVGSNSGGGNVIAMTQAEYNALTTEEKNDGKLRIITDAPTEDISVDWSNVANKFVDISTQTGTLSSVKIWVGSQTDYEALATKDSNTLYFTTNVVSGS